VVKVPTGSGNWAYRDDISPGGMLFGGEKSKYEADTVGRRTNIKIRHRLSPKPGCQIDGATPSTGKRGKHILESRNPLPRKGSPASPKRVTLMRTRDRGFGRDEVYLGKRRSSTSGKRLEIDWGLIASSKNDLS